MKKHRTIHEYKIRKNKLNPNKTTKFILKKSTSNRLMDSFLRDTDKYFMVFKKFAQLNANYHDMCLSNFNEIRDYFLRVAIESCIYDEIPSEDISINNTLNLENNFQLSVKSLNGINSYKELSPYENSYEPLNEYDYYLEPEKNQTKISN